MALLEIYVPEKYRGSVAFHSAMKLMGPVLAAIRKMQPKGPDAAPYLTGMLCSLAGPLVGYLGREGALEAVKHLKSCVKRTNPVRKDH